MSVSVLGRLKNHNVPHLHPNFTMFMPLNRLQLKICAFSGKFNVCSKCALLSWIKICRDFTLQTQIFTQKYRSWLRFYSEFLRKKLAVEVSGSYFWCWALLRLRRLVGCRMVCLRKYTYKELTFVIHNKYIKSLKRRHVWNREGFVAIGIIIEICFLRPK